MTFKDLLEAIAAVLIPLGSWYIALQTSRRKDRTLPVDIRTEESQAAMNEANALQTLQNTIAEQAKENERVRKIWDDDMRLLRTSVEDLRKQVDELKSNLVQRDHWIRDLIDWIRRLIFQIKSYNHTPVPFQTVYPDVSEEETMKRIG